MELYYDKRVQRSKAAIKEAFITLLYQKTFEQITVSEIVKEANYNRGTFYANFETKDNLLNECIKDVLTEMVQQIRVPYESMSKVNFHEMNSEDITLFHYFKGNAKLYRLLLSDHIRVDFRYQMAKAIEELFIAEYNYVMSEGTILDPKWLYIYRAHGVAGLIIRWIEEDFSEEPEYMAKQIIELMVTSTDGFYVKD
ncbi:TetR family transcriptional regulator [Oceanobacillus piezotolerans]|uniref:TetR family transcriptional regulator n=1 Tax=Oceanobacillus piezotolerans TaxID=2448030 RepID=A0A498D561_9BACI|nr:TetR/AcrR family transcriptional regulator [Oceanobacillus piezotolerans]RLL44858.1 TetR family transcriptional regulator [Oceanobacillus piezotolerans]